MFYIEFDGGTLEGKCLMYGKNLRIAHLISSYLPSSIGGAQVCVHNIAKRHTSLGHKVAIITASKNSAKLLSSLTNYEIVQLLRYKFLHRQYVIGCYLLFVQLYAIQKKYNFDVWQVTIGWPYGSAAADFFRKYNIPCILRCSGEDLQKDAEVNYGVRLDRKIDRRIRNTYRKYDALVAISDTVRNEYIELGIPEDKIYTIPNGVDCQRFGRNISTDGIRERLNIPHDARVILTVGRNHPKKGYEYIPATIKDLLKLRDDFVWFVVGKDSKRLSSKAKALGVMDYLILIDGIGLECENESFEIPSVKLVELYKLADIFVLPTKIETFGIVLIEALAAGCPVITTNIPGVTDFIQAYENGILVDYGDIRSLVYQIDNLLSNEALSRKYSRNGVQYSINFNWNKIANEYLEVYYKLISQRK